MGMGWETAETVSSYLKKFFFKALLEKKWIESYLSTFRQQRSTEPAALSARGSVFGAPELWCCPCTEHFITGFIK